MLTDSLSTRRARQHKTTQWFADKGLGWVENAVCMEACPPCAPFCKHAGSLMSPINHWLEKKGAEVVTSVASWAKSFAEDLWDALDEEDYLDSPELQALRAQI